jgi:hypothetical protein
VVVVVVKGGEERAHQSRAIAWGGACVWCGTGPPGALVYQCFGGLSIPVLVSSSVFGAFAFVL